jgi:hypothetical protein
MSHNIRGCYPHFSSDIIGPSHKKIKVVFDHLSIMGMAYPLLSYEVDIQIDRKTAQWGTTLMVGFRMK